MTKPKSARAPRVKGEELRDQELLVVREIAKLLGKSLEPSFAIREMLHLLSEFLGLNRGRVVLRDDEGEGYSIRYAYGLTQEEILRGRYGAGEGITGRVVNSGETVIIQDIDADPSYLGRAVERKKLPNETVSFIAVPVEQEGRVVGALGVHRLRQRKRALADDLQILKIIAAFVGQVLHLNRLVAQRTARLESENRELKWALERNPAQFSSYGIVGESPLLRKALHQIEQVAVTDATVLLLGESGTGKELFARALHMSSPRRDSAFVKVNCGAIPENLFESELFGHEKGAFTGATACRAGYFELADGGTLFLDEIGDLPLPMQVKLLRALQESTIQRVGGRKEVKINVRIAAATNQDLQSLVSQGKFRLDLYYRLNVIPIRLPSLRERREDVRHLARYYLNQIDQTYQRNVNISPEALERLSEFPWPGNIRQLRNVLERLALLADDLLISAEDVAGVLAGEEGPSMAAPAAQPPAVAFAPAESATVRPYHAVQGHEKAHIESALRQTNNNKSRAAQLLGMTLRQLNYRIKVLQIGT